YHKRWRNPGDEAFTQIPSMIYPNIPARDEFYLYSQALIEKGDHIRLRDIRLTWELPLKAKQALGLKSCRIYSYINNIGILWRANKANIDPDHITGFPNPRSYAIGVQLDF
ncbi:MAG: SusC/RagA family TonB-linked outer membrane protein, partial [Chitinophagaceae bacterium]|nr:SusC/RagA family TonB-linked outer membrane protein [Chitinophagaceae bacterium]